MISVWRISTKGISEVPNPVKYKKGKKKSLLPGKILSAEGKTPKDQKIENETDKSGLPERDLILAKVKPFGKQAKESKSFSKAWKGEPEDPQNCYALLKNLESSNFNLGFLGDPDRWTELVAIEGKTVSLVSYKPSLGLLQNNFFIRF